ncbi:MAG: segregation/condensation protein A [Clostridia bacterium]|nr:segregation/condensation protein A [Clostridia bacterium]
MEQSLSFKLETFEGPLDLLLHLIAKNKLNIYDISICDLLEQYMEHIHAWQEQNMEIASEFLEMASRLVYIKSASLLPKPEEADQLKDQLAGELLEYQTCRQLAAMLAARTEGFDRMVREPAKVEPDQTYLLTHEPPMLAHYYLAAVGRGLRRLPPPEAHFTPLVKKTVISVSSRIVYVLRHLFGGKKLKLQSLFARSQNRSEAVATFLAVLELIRERRVALDDNDELAMVEGVDEP